MASIYPRPRGEMLGRVLRSMVTAGGDHEAAQQFALHRWPGEGVSGMIDKAYAASMTGTTWGEEAAGLATVRNEFVELTTIGTIAGKAGVRIVPLNTRVLSTTGSSAAAWVGEGKTAAVSNLSISPETVRPLKVVALVAMTKEFLESGSPRIEQFIVRDLTRVTREALDLAFIDPANTGTPGIKPISITSGALQITATGGFGSEAEIAALKSDFRRLLALYTGNWESAVFVASTPVAVALQLVGIPFFGPDAAIIPMIHSANMPGDGGSPATDFIALLDSSAIISGDLGVTIEAFKEGDIMLSGTSMDSVTPTPAQLTSMFQTNTMAIRATIYTNWNPPASGKVVLLTGIPRE